MSYSDLYLKEKSRPSQIMVVVALLATVSAIGYYFLSYSAPTRASKQVIKQHQLVNVLPKQAGIFWEVETSDEGWLVYGENPSKLNEISLDERDADEERKKRKYHYVLLKNLSPETTYYYKIISNNELVSAQNNEPFSVQTISEGTLSSSLSPSYGKVVSESGDPLVENIVILSVTNAYPLVSLTKQTGEWLIPLQYVVSNKDRSSVPVSENTIVTIRIFNESQQSLVKASLSQTHPVPQTVTMGSNYTFIGDDNVLAATDSNKKTDNSFRVELQYPRNNAVIPGTSPLIKGKGIPGKSVSIQINSRPAFITSTRVDNDGFWSVSVLRSIAPGSYTINMKTQDNRGKQVEIKRNFTLIKSGEQVLAAASGSATITASSSPTLIAEETGEPSPTEVLEEELTPTPETPVSGISMVPFLFAGIGLILIGAGFVLFL